METNQSTILSSESQTFIENLRLYLVSSGKHSEEIEEIIEELSDHLSEAEKAGKPISKVVGVSPRAYMESLSHEMKLDLKTCLKYVAIILFGGFAFQIMMDLVSGSMAYSLFKIGSDIAISLIWIILLSITFKYIAANILSKKKEITILAGISAFPLILFFTVLFTDPYIPSPVIEINTVGMIILGLIASLSLIAISIWSKTWILIVFMSLIILPDYLLQFSGLNESTQLLVGMCITYGGMILYMMFFMWRMEKKEVKS